MAETIPMTHRIQNFGCDNDLSVGFSIHSYPNPVLFRLQNDGLSRRSPGKSVVFERWHLDNLCFESETYGPVALANNKACPIPTGTAWRIILVAMA